MIDLIRPVGYPILMRIEDAGQPGRLLTHSKWCGTLPIVVMIMVFVIASGCSYSRWGYVPVEKRVEGGGWSLHPGMNDVGARPMPGTKPDCGDTLFYYGIALEEIDTTRFPRLRFEVGNVVVTYPGQSDSVTLVQEETHRGRGLYNGATNVYQSVIFSVFRLPKPRPDTIRVDQDIAIFREDSDEAVNRFHYQFVGALRQYKYSRIAEFIAGT